jgi:hypothetical protein
MSSASTMSLPERSSGQGIDPPPTSATDTQMMDEATPPVLVRSRSSALG